jgi:preprotein translocase subunit SecG
MFTFLIVLLILDAIVLVIAVLLQAGQGGGLASLGGGAGTDMFMGGRQAVTLLTKISWWSGAIFLSLALLLSVMSSRAVQPRSVLEGSVPAPQPVQNAAPLPLEGQGQTPPAQPAPQKATPPPQKSPTRNQDR